MIDQLNAWDDFNRVEHDALVVPAARAPGLTALCTAMPPTSGDHQMISISYECSYTPPFIARDTLAVHHQHLEAKVALGRQAGMQEDSAVECSTEPSNINYIGSYIPSAWNLQRICSAKLQVLRKGRHGGQREKRSFAHPRSCAQKTTTLGARERPIL